MKEKEPVVPIKKKSTFKKSPLIKYGSGYADQNTGGSKIRTVFKDWDESYEVGTTKKHLNNLENMLDSIKHQASRIRKILSS